MEPCNTQRCHDKVGLHCTNTNTDTDTKTKTTVGFHNFNLRILNLRVSTPNKLIVDVFWHDVGFQCARVSSQKTLWNFGNRPYYQTLPENLSHYLWTNGFLSNPAPGENILGGNLAMETGCTDTKTKTNTKPCPMVR